MQNYLSKRFPALKFRDFRIFSLSHFVSNTGSQMHNVAITWQIYEITKSPLALGLIGLFSFLPIALLSLLGGSVADTYNRKKILSLINLFTAFLSLVMAVITYNNMASETVILIIVGLFASARAFEIPARQAFFPKLVSINFFTNAVSLNSILIQTAKILGPTIAGLLIAHTNLAIIYSLNAISFLVIILGYFLISDTGKIEVNNSTISLGNIIEGLKFVRSRTIIWSTMLLDFFSTLFSSATTLFPIFAQDILNVGPEKLGLLFAAPSIGSVVAGFVVAHKHELSNQGKILLISIAFYGLGTLIFGLSKTFIVSFVALFVVGMGDSISTIIRNTIRQLETPDHLRGRMASINMIFVAGGPPLGEFEGGILANYMGAPVSVILGGIGTLIVVSLTALGIPVLRNYDKHQKR